MSGMKNMRCSEQKVTAVRNENRPGVRNEKYVMFVTERNGCSEQKVTDALNEFWCLLFNIEKDSFM
jgi:hypothetical protein